MTNQQIQLKRGIVKQVLSGDSLIIREFVGAPPPEKQISLSGVTAPKLARRETSSNDETKDEPWAWEAREYLRQKLVGKEVWYSSEKPGNVNREYGIVYMGKDPATAENITESLVSEGLVSVREGGRQTPELVRLAELEEAAKAAGKGKWGTGAPSEHIRDIKWSIENPRTFVDKLKYKPVKAVIEHVRDGSTVRAFLLPDFYHITLMISGIRSPGFKLDDKGRPDPNIVVQFAEEAKCFVELRLLQRDVEVVLESVNNNNFVGTILHPKGNIAELLLREGLARCVDWSMSFMQSGADKDKLRAAEKSAKEKRLKLWHDWKSSAPQITGKEKEFSGTVVEVINGDALNVKLANGQTKKIFLSSIRPPKEKLDPDGKAAPRPKGFRPLYDIPFMFEAREFLRKKLIDKKVHVVVDYIQEARDNYPEKICGTVTLGGNNVAATLVSKGLATVVRYRQDDDQRSSHYDELLAEENKAIKSQNGIHGKKDNAAIRITEINDQARAKQHLSTFKRGRTDAIAEFVASGSRLRLFIPKHNCLCTFLLGGISCPRASRPAVGNAPASNAEPFGDEALAFTKDRCLQRQVSVQMDSVDKAGNFIGWLWINNVNLSVALVEEGYATVHPSAEKTEFFKFLEAAENNAKKQRIGCWKNYEEKEEEEEHVTENVKTTERKVNYEEVVVTEITPDGTFFAQSFELGPKAEALNAKIRQDFASNPPIPGNYKPKRNEICAAKYTVDNEWYRAKVERIQGQNATVLYIDYGNRETLNTSRLASLPSAYTSDKPFAAEYSLAFVGLPKDQDFVELLFKYLREDTGVSKLLLNVEYRVQGLPPAATLVNEALDEPDIIKNLVSDGLLIVDDRRERTSNKLYSEYKAAQDDAKKKRLNIWQYGDITDDDAKEFGVGR